MYLSETQSGENCIYVPKSRAVNNLIEDVYENLIRRPRSLPPKYFYDESGSLLFDQICNTQEYYPTRIEAGLLEQYACEFIAEANPDHILEFGSGTSRNRTGQILYLTQRGACATGGQGMSRKLL